MKKTRVKLELRRERLRVVDISQAAGGDQIIGSSRRQISICGPECPLLPGRPSGQV